MFTELGRYIQGQSKLRQFLFAVAGGTTLGFLISISGPLINAAKVVAQPYQLPLPEHSVSEGLLILFSVIAIAIMLKVPGKLWFSLKLGLIPLQNWILFSAAAVFWIANDWHHRRVAWGTIAVAALSVGVLGAIARQTRKEDRGRLTGPLESDLPVPEGGEDLLGRRDRIDELVSTILLEQPAVIAVTGRYGDGKTSFLNLTIGELKKAQVEDLPVIVKFSPWLAPDSNTLVLSLLNSIVATIKENFIVPSLSGDALRFARTLLGVSSTTERLKQLIDEPSQEGRIDGLVNTISRIHRRILVVLDDLDRLQGDELETVLKVLRGSDRLSNITFLCAFSPPELEAIVKVTRPGQDSALFIEKFFPIRYDLPKVEPSDLRNFLEGRIAEIFRRFNAGGDEGLTAVIRDIWDGRAALYFGNLRRIKLFTNRIGQSLQRIAGEVNTGDFIRIEMIRTITPELYETIYRSPEYFWNREFAFETAFTGLDALDDKRAKKQRADFYDTLKVLVSSEKDYVFRLLEDLFPHFADYRSKYRPAPLQGAIAESEKRICHPRYFRQYFLLRVPSELFSQHELVDFIDSIQHSTEEQTATAFSSKFQSLANQDFRRWHFMHLLENSSDQLSLQTLRGLCRGMARNSGGWPTDAFELLIAIRMTREALRKSVDEPLRHKLLNEIINESASDLYTLILFRRLENEEAETGMKPLPGLRDTEKVLTQHLRRRYIIPNSPSVFQQFGNFGPGRVDPVQFLFSWQLLGAEAHADEQEYLRDLFTRRPKDINDFLKIMFRAFIDDYNTLKSALDYGELDRIIALNEDILDPENVKKFRAHYRADREGATPTPEEPPSVISQVDQIDISDC